MKNIQVIDGADNCTFPIFQCDDASFALIFPAEGQDIEFAEDFQARWSAALETALEGLWKRPILKRDALGIHGTIFYEFEHRRPHFPATKREIDWDNGLNPAQQELYAAARPD